MLSDGKYYEKLFCVCDETALKQKIKQVKENQICSYTVLCNQLIMSSFFPHPPNEMLIISCIVACFECLDEFIV